MSSEASSKPPKRGGKDACWEYGERVNEKDPNWVRCKFCSQSMSGGISRLKKHLAGIKGDCTGCNVVPEEAKKKVLGWLNIAKKKKEAKEFSMKALIDDIQVGEEEGEEEEEDGSSQKSSCLSIKTKGPMDMFATRTPEELVEITKKKQTKIDDKYKQKAREDTVGYIAKWFYEAGIPFNSTTLPSFQQMLQAVGKFGPCLRAPTPYELGETYLKKEVEETRDRLKHFFDSCSINGCSLMTDAWTDRKGRSIMNIVAHCQAGTAFLNSFDTSSHKHDAEFIYNLVNAAIEEMGENKVVQVVTDNAANNMAAANLLKLRRPNVFWTCCAAHTINLMLGDIAKIKNVRRAIMDSRFVTVFLYAHTLTHNMLTTFTKDREIIRPGVTRFATAFLTLNSFRDLRKDLKRMFCSPEWEGSTFSEMEEGKKVQEFILSAKFWDNIVFALKIFGPLVRVLRRVDGDKLPSMGFVYGDLEMAKEDIKNNVDSDEKKYLPIWKYVDTRWDAKLKTPLHRAGYYLNPFFYYRKKEAIEMDGTFLGGVVECMAKFYSNSPEVVERISEQLETYQHAKGSFGRDLAQNAWKRPNFNPALWWSLYGTDAPDLRRMAMRILSLTTSSSGCERNWSAFEMIHSKKRNRLLPEKLRDLVFVKFNARLRTQSSISDRDPLAVYHNDEGKVTEWKVRPTQNNAPNSDSEDDEVFPGEGLTWAQVAEATGADPRPRRGTRIRTYKRTRISKEGASSSKRPARDVSSEEEPTLPTDDSSSEEE